MKNEKYNGWENYATWRVNLELVDGDYYGEILKNNEYEDKDEAVFILAEYIQDDIETYLEENCNNNTTSAYALAFVSNVNWYEIAKHICDDYIQSK